MAEAGAIGAGGVEPELAAVVREWGPGVGTNVVAEQLEHWMRVCAAVVRYKRRLGADATSAELAADKKVARRMGHDMATGLALLGRDVNWVMLCAVVWDDLEVRAEAATVRWEWWARDVVARIDELCEQLAAWAYVHPLDCAAEARDCARACAIVRGRVWLHAGLR